MSTYSNITMLYSKPNPYGETTCGVPVDSPAYLSANIQHQGKKDE